MSCQLRISGTEFDVDAFVAETGWSESGIDMQVYRKGEYVNSLKKHVHPHSGLRITVSSADFTDFEQQHEDLMAFLREYKNALKLLSKYKIDGWRSFDFGVDTFPPNSFSRTYTLAPALISMCSEAGMGIVISNYFSAKEPRRRGRIVRKFNSKKKYR